MAKKKVDWAAYDRSLKQRGSITFWFSNEAIRAWSPEPTGKRGGQAKFSDLAIKTSLSLRLIFKQGLRQTEGLIGSKLRSRDFEAQKNEIKIGCKILNTMVKLGTPLHPAMIAK